MTHVLFYTCKACGHETDEYTLDFREYCKGCGNQPKEDTPEAWDAFLETFDYEYVER